MPYDPDPLFVPEDTLEYRIGYRDGKHASDGRVSIALWTGIVAGAVCGAFLALIVVGPALASRSATHVSLSEVPEEQRGAQPRPRAAMTPRLLTPPSPASGIGTAPGEASADPTTPPQTHRTEQGIASHMGSGFGPGYLALPEGPGHRVRICGELGCVEQVSNDAGPALFMQRRPHNRVADLSVATFERVCGPASMGLCEVTVTYIHERQSMSRATLPPTDVP